LSGDTYSLTDPLISLLQFAGLGFLAIGFLDYFALGNINGSASPLFTLGIFSALLGIALQRKA
jgi:hypothetical protein